MASFTFSFVLIFCKQNNVLTRFVITAETWHLYKSKIKSPCSLEDWSRTLDFFEIITLVRFAILLFLMVFITVVSSTVVMKKNKQKSHVQSSRSIFVLCVRATKYSKHKPNYTAANYIKWRAKVRKITRSCFVRTRNTQFCF